MQVSEFLFGDGFAISGGDEWRVRRKAVGPSLHKAYLAEMTDRVFGPSAQNLCSKLEVSSFPCFCSSPHAAVRTVRGLCNASPCVKLSFRSTPVGWEWLESSATSGCVQVILERASLPAGGCQIWREHRHGGLLLAAHPGRHWKGSLQL